MENSNGKNFKGKNVLIGLTGSIACYKTCELIRLLTKSGANVKTVLSPSALEFIGVKTLETLTNNMVYTNTFAPRTGTEHISLADWANLFVVAPVSANTISKFACGLADNLITSIFCAYFGKKKPVIIAPAMNTGMLNNPFVKKNIETLLNEGVKIVESEVGELACGAVGEGKMANVQKIYDKMAEILCNDYDTGVPSKNKKVVITAGGTKEPIDPVRYISNSSSGKMGIALADCAQKMGYEVELISTVKVSGKPYNVKFVNSADEMLIETEKSFKNADYLIMAAAVADFKVKNSAAQKISKEEILKNGGSLNIELALNADILKNMGQIKKDGQKTIGFSLGTQNIIETAKAKLIDKNADFMIANEAKVALNSDENEVWIISKDEIFHIDKNTKENVAKAILERVL